MTSPCPRCSRNWSTARDGAEVCLLHGEYHTAPLILEAPASRGEAWTDDEEQFVYENRGTMSYREMAAELEGRTQKAVEHLVHSRGWDKPYVRRQGGPAAMAPMPRGLPPADRAVAVLIRERALNGWAVSLAQLGAATGMARPNVVRSLRRLVARGLIEVDRKADPWHGNRANSYRWVVSDSDNRVEGH